MLSFRSDIHHHSGMLPSLTSRSNVTKSVSYIVTYLTHLKNLVTLVSVAMARHVCKQAQYRVVLIDLLNHHCLTALTVNT
jgi:hypothetical protein